MARRDIDFDKDCVVLKLQFGNDQYRENCLKKSFQTFEFIYFHQNKKLVFFLLPKAKIDDKIKEKQISFITTFNRKRLEWIFELQISFAGNINMNEIEIRSGFHFVLSKFLLFFSWRRTRTTSSAFHCSIQCQIDNRRQNQKEKHYNIFALLWK